ncbi:hypothetical protein SESBI_23205 [Sesbania bispinosa]|nr:hypothetical protein SESBI_23205 [Sesbania bispinosa]
METPSSTRRVTRSQALAATANSIPPVRKIEDSEKNLSKSKGQQQQQDRCALMDLTNDSPIVGLANGGNLETPFSKHRGSRVKNTPGSGEALLRGQVKTLLQKVEEEALELLPPTPQIQNLSGNATTALASATQQSIPQVVNHIFDEKNQEDYESEKSLITRSLLLDFSEKSQVSEECSSEMSYQEVVQGSGVSSCYIEKPSSATTEDDDASIWSVQGLNNISVNERIAPKFEGKHTRFMYNSDDELVTEEEEENSVSSSDIMRLKGLPTPKGKHLRFSEEEDMEEEGKSAL